MYSIEVLGLDALRQRVRNLPKQFRYAGARALNDVAFLARGAVVGEMQKVFDRPTPFILRSTRVIKATPDKLSVSIFPDSPGGKSVDPVNVLRAEVFGHFHLLGVGQLGRRQRSESSGHSCARGD